MIKTLNYISIYAENIYISNSNLFSIILYRELHTLVPCANAMLGTLLFAKKFVKEAVNQKKIPGKSFLKLRNVSSELKTNFVRFFLFNFINLYSLAKCEKLMHI